MPRRIPLLGVESPMLVKQHRAFTIQAEQDIWDIGTANKTQKVGPLKESNFRECLRTGKYPFVQDHSGSLSEPRLAWLTELQNVDYNIILPDLIDGLTENHLMYYRIANMALRDMLKHGPLEKIVEALPHLTYAIKKVLSHNNKTIAHRVVSFLKELCILQSAVGPDLAYYIHEIVTLLNPFMEKMSGNRDNIEYNSKPDLYDSINDLLKHLELIAGPERDLALRSIKKAIPTYQIK